MPVFLRPKSKIIPKGTIRIPLTDFNEIDQRIDKIENYWHHRILQIPFRIWRRLWHRPYFN